MLTQEDIDWVFLDTVDSTNTYLVKAYAAGQHRGVTAVLAKTQTQGRGRAGRVWVSEPGQGLCLSIGLPVDCKTMPCLPICVGVGLAEGLKSLGVSVSLKWPNDVLVQGAKLAGVLCEGGVAETGSFTVVGVGVNIHPLLLPNGPAGLPLTSLAQHWIVGKPLPSPKELAARLVPCVVSAIESCVRFGLSALMSCFERRDAFFGQEVRVLDKGQEQLRGLALGLAPDGAYRIQTPDGESRVYVGDLSLRGIHDH